MNQEEHLSMARELMRRADQESAADGGNEMIAAEFLWGAFVHCLITVAQNAKDCPTTATERSAESPSTWTQPREATNGVLASVHPNNSTSTSTTENCRPGNCALTDSAPQKAP